MRKKSRKKKVFDATYKEKFVGQMRKGIERADDYGDDTMMKKFLKKFEETNPNEVQDLKKEIEISDKALQDYTLKHLRNEDFIFTDWENEDEGRGIKGHSEVQRIIQEYKDLIQISSSENLSL